MRLIPNTLRALRARLGAENGFSMVTAMGAMLVVMMASAAALAASGGDHGLARDDIERKQAYAAAEAGLHDYIQDLNNDNAYWSKCTNVPAPNAVNDRWTGNGADTRTRWRSVPQPVNDPRAANIQYAIELIPANGAANCNENSSAQTMLDSATGTFRIRSTGRVRKPQTACPSATPCYEKRSIVAQFRRRGFLDYLYFTDYETSDPAWYAQDAYGLATDPDIVGWATTDCSRYWRDGRGTKRYYDPDGDGDQDGKIYYNGTWYPYFALLPCDSIQFANGDKIRGPFHTNDEILVCGSPDFGRSSGDAIEVSAPAPGYRPTCGSGSAPQLVGGAEWKPNSPIIAMPPSNTKIKQVTQANYLFTGRTDITLNGSSMSVTNAAAGLNNTNMSLPSNGVIYIQNGNCSGGYNPYDPYPANAPGCADLYLQGSYSADLTIASEKDIVIKGDVKRSGGGSPVDKVLGLIANNFVRIYHPVDYGNGCSNMSGTLQNVTVEAAILALQHSFTVDNFNCGSALGTLRVFGAIAQKFRGPVGTGGSSGVNTGYLKDYEYDDRLRLRQPPHFLDPVQSAWRIMRQWEQVPAL